jgi:hypothetical protein
MRAIHSYSSLSLSLSAAPTNPQGLLQRLGPIAAAAAIFLGGYGTGLASSDMYADIRVAEQRRDIVSAEAPQGPKLAGVPVRQTSLKMPDKVCAGV